MTLRDTLKEFPFKETPDAVGVVAPASPSLESLISEAMGLGLWTELQFGQAFDGKWTARLGQYLPAGYRWWPPAYGLTASEALARAVDEAKTNYCRGQIDPPALAPHEKPRRAKGKPKLDIAALLEELEA